MTAPAEYSSVVTREGSDATDLLRSASVRSFHRTTRLGEGSRRVQSEPGFNAR